MPIKEFYLDRVLAELNFTQDEVRNGLFLPRSLCCLRRFLHDYPISLYDRHAAHDHLIYLPGHPVSRSTSPGWPLKFLLPFLNTPIFCLSGPPKVV